MPSILDYLPFIGEGVNSATSIVGSLLSNRANKRLASLQYERALEMWNKQNAYNSPAAQMSRFKQAGLNPNLIYGQGSAGNASTPPQYQAPNMKYDFGQLQLGNAVGAYIDLKAKTAGIQNMLEKNRGIKISNDTKQVQLDILRKYGDPLQAGRLNLLGLQGLNLAGRNVLLANANQWYQLTKDEKLKALKLSNKRAELQNKALSNANLWFKVSYDTRLKILNQNLQNMRSKWQIQDMSWENLMRDRQIKDMILQNRDFEGGKEGFLPAAVGLLKSLF